MHNLLHILFTQQMPPYKNTRAKCLRMRKVSIFKMAVGPCELHNKNAFFELKSNFISIQNFKAGNALCLFTLYLFALCLFTLCLFALCQLCLFALCLFALCLFALCLFALRLFALCLFALRLLPLSMPETGFALQLRFDGFPI